MDEVGLRELIKSGVRSVAAAREEQRAGRALAEVRSRVGTTLDRLAQVGVIAIEHKVEWLWNELLEGLLAAYKLTLPRDEDTMSPPEPEVQFLVDVIHRAFLLGAFATQRRLYRFLPALVRRQPIDRFKGYYWFRYSVTMAARGELKDAFKGKSLIGTASEYVRERPQFFVLYDSNADNVVNSMCRFDFLQCVAVTVETEDVSECYPNFGAYYQHRTLPIVYDLIDGGPSREAIGKISDSDLAEILRSLDKYAREGFFDVNGWRGYDERVHTWLSKYPGVV